MFWHTLVQLLDDENQMAGTLARIFWDKRIDIDCGCGCVSMDGCLCMDTMEEIYIGG